MKRRPARRRARMRFVGALDPVAFARFAARRAALLQVEALWGPAESRAFECEVAGAPEMVDAFEMACWLGPPGAMIASVERQWTEDEP